MSEQIEVGARDDRFKSQLDQIGTEIGYGRAIQLLGQLWDDMLQATYPQVSRHQEQMFRRTDIERIEAGLPIGRKIVYVPKRGYKGVLQLTAFGPMEMEVKNVGRVVAETLLYGRASAVGAGSQPEIKHDAVLATAIGKLQLLRNPFKEQSHLTIYVSAWDQAIEQAVSELKSIAAQQGENGGAA